MQLYSFSKYTCIFCNATALAMVTGFKKKIYT